MNCYGFKCQLRIISEGNKMTLRLCYTRTNLLRWNPDPKKATGGRFNGGLSGLVNEYVSLLLKVTSNVTVHSEDFAFEEQDQGKRYAGCLGRLQQNQSDLIATETLYPTIGEKMTTGPVIYADKMAFLSSYSDVFPRQFADIMQSFTALSTTVWYLIITTALLILLMISISKALTKSQRAAMKKWAKHKRMWKQRYKQKRKILRSISAPAKMTSKSKKQGKNILCLLFYNGLIKRSTKRTNRSSLSVATLILMLIILSFYVSFFFIAIVKTKKVVVTKPPTIDSYDDIINSYPGKENHIFIRPQLTLTVHACENGFEGVADLAECKTCGIKTELSFVNGTTP